MLGKRSVWRPLLVATKIVDKSFLFVGVGQEATLIVLDICVTAGAVGSVEADLGPEVGVLKDRFLQ